ncbi:MAG: ferrochelatase [Acidobacteriota bacterium]
MPDRRRKQTKSIGVLLMAYGGPLSLDEVEPYLLDVRGGRPMTAEFLEEVRQRYRLIGGRSPLLDITLAQAAALQQQLGAPFKVYVGMRHWHPYIADVVAEMARDEVSEVVALCMAPQYSALSIGAYYRQFDEALQKTGLAAPVRRIESWCEDPGFLDALAARTRATLKRFPSAERLATPLLLTAHSLPVGLASAADPYVDQLEKTARGLLARLRPSITRLAYQSASRTSQVPWLGPDAGDVITAYAKEGYRGVVLVPIGFVADHVEILYDIDIVYFRQADELNMRLERSESLNDSPDFIAALARLVEQARSAEPAAAGP